MSLQNDILSEIPDDELPKLAALYKEKAPWAPYMFTFVHTGIKWKKSNKYRDCITFLSPNNSWKEDGTVIILITMFTQDICVFTLDDKCINLYHGLSKTNRIIYSKRVYFYAVHEKFAPTVKKYLEDKKKNTSEFSCFLFGLPPEETQKFTTEFDTYNCQNICTIMYFPGALPMSTLKNWNPQMPPKSTICGHIINSDKYIEGFIDANGGYGVFLKSTDQMVAWAVRHAFGNPTMLQTEIDHKRKGYASLAIKALAKEIGQEEYWTVVTVILHNKAALTTFEKLGFRCLSTHVFISVE